MWGTYEIGPSRRASAGTGIEGYDPDALYEQYVQQMTNPKFRDRMARAADRARGGDGNAAGKDTSHPMLWAKAKREGLVMLGSVGEVQRYIMDAASYEDLFDRIDFVSKEWEYYGLSDKYREMVQQTMRDTRDRILGQKGNYSTDGVDPIGGNSTNARSFANSLRSNRTHILTPDEIEQLTLDARSIGIDPTVLRFNEGIATAYDERTMTITVRGDVIPDLSSTRNRDTMTARAVLAHEYYGHAQYPNSSYLPGHWADEFRASYRAALDTPGLTDEERASLMIDAYERAAEAGVRVRYNKYYKAIVYGYSGEEEE